MMLLYNDDIKMLLNIPLLLPLLFVIFKIVCKNCEQKLSLLSIGLSLLIGVVEIFGRVDVTSYLVVAVVLYLTTLMMPLSVPILVVTLSIRCLLRSVFLMS
jgi:hypothetical protein